MSSKIFSNLSEILKYAKTIQVHIVFTTVLCIWCYFISSRSCLFSRIPIKMRANVTYVTYLPLQRFRYDIISYSLFLCTKGTLFVQRNHQYLGCGTGYFFNFPLDHARQKGQWVITQTADIPWSGLSQFWRICRLVIFAGFFLFLRTDSYILSISK